jgi:MFS family permease
MAVSGLRRADRSSISRPISRKNLDRQAERNQGLNHYSSARNPLGLDGISRSAAAPMSMNLRPIASLLFGVALLMAGNGLQFTLLPLRGEVEGFGTIALGLIGSAYFVGFVSGCLLGPYIVLRAGHIRAFAAMVAVTACVALAYGLMPLAPAWAIFRAVTGLCFAVLYLVIESWLNDHATNATRGLMMSTYTLVSLVALAAGQMLVTLYPIDQASSFMIAAMLLSLASVPVALTRSAQPAPITIVSFHPRELFQAAPVALVASLMIGVANGAFWSLATVFATGSGLDVSQAAEFMVLAMLAGALMQWPIGRLSDSVDRRLVLLLLLAAAAATSFLLWMVAPSGVLLLGLGALFGALALPGYSLAAAHAYDKTPAGRAVATAATILLASGLGSIAGPLIAAMLMASQGPRALFLFIGVVEGLLASYVLYRMRVQVALTSGEKIGFDLGATSPIGAVVTPAIPDPDDPVVAVPEQHPAPSTPP